MVDNEYKLRGLISYRFQGIKNYINVSNPHGYYHTHVGTVWEETLRSCPGFYTPTLVGEGYSEVTLLVPEEML